MSETNQIDHAEVESGQPRSMLGVLHDSMEHGRHSSFDVPVAVPPPPRKSSKSLSMADAPILTASHGQMQNAPSRPSPGPQSQGQPGLQNQGLSMPNSKSGTPYNERNNPMGPNGHIAANTVSSKDPKTAAQAANDMRNVVRRKLTGYVGFANLPNQWHRKSVRKGFNFNVMVVGMFDAFLA